MSIMKKTATLLRAVLGRSFQMSFFRFSVRAVRNIKKRIASWKSTHNNNIIYYYITSIFYLSPKKFVQYFIINNNCSRP